MNICRRNIDFVSASGKSPTVGRYFISSVAVQCVYWMSVRCYDEWYTRRVRRGQGSRRGSSITRTAWRVAWYRLLDLLHDEHPFA